MMCCWAGTSRRRCRSCCLVLRIAARRGKGSSLTLLGRWKTRRAMRPPRIATATALQGFTSPDCHSRICWNLVSSRRTCEEALHAPKKTKLYALCADGRIETDDVACVTPAGQLCLSLTPRAYTRLGISGISSDDGTPKRRCLVNLAKKNFQPGNPFRDRLIGNAARVSKTDTALAVKRKYLVMHTSGGDDTLTPVLSPEGCEVTAHCLKYKRSVVATSDAPGAPVSFFSKKKSGSNDDEDDAYASPTENAAESLSLFHEWLGKLSSVGNSGTQTSPPCVCGGEKDVSDRDDPSFVEKHRWSGFMNPNQTRSALSFCRALVKDGTFPWAAVTTWGFPDDPSRFAVPLNGGGEVTAIGGAEHVTFVVVPGDGYVMYTQPGR